MNKNIFTFKIKSLCFIIISLLLNNIELYLNIHNLRILIYQDTKLLLLQ
jgi:hypothetical protein